MIHVSRRSLVAKNPPRWHWSYKPWRVFRTKRGMCCLFISPNSFGYRGSDAGITCLVFTMWHLKIRCALSVNLIWLVWIKTMFLVGWQGILFGHLVYLNITVSLKHHVFVEKSTSQPIFMLPLHKFWCWLYQSACWATRFVCCQEFVNTTARIPKLFQWWNGALTIILGWNINPPNLDQTMTLNTASSNGLFQPLRRTNMDSRLVTTNHCLKRHCLEWKEEISVVMNSKCLASLKLFLHTASANSLNFNPPIGAKPTA